MKGRDTQPGDGLFLDITNIYSLMKLHNPDKLTPKQYGKAEGYRLLWQDEVGPQFMKELAEIECWVIHSWWPHLAGYGGTKSYPLTYRTKLTRAELRARRSS